MKELFTRNFRRLMPRAAMVAFEVVAGVISLIWALIMLFSALLAFGLGLVFAHDHIVPALGMDPGFLSNFVSFFVAFICAFVAVVVVEVVEIILLLLIIGVIACLIAAVAAGWQKLRS